MTMEKLRRKISDAVGEHHSYLVIKIDEHYLQFFDWGDRHVLEHKVEKSRYCNVPTEFSTSWQSVDIDKTKIMLWIIDNLPLIIQMFADKSEEYRKAECKRKCEKRYMEKRLETALGELYD
jgi:hypothetical protein